MTIPDTGPTLVWIGGRAFEMVTVRIEDLHEWARRERLQAVGRLVWPDGEDWPPLIEWRRLADDERQG